ncbi:hypothetical protein NC713_05105 [Pseudidiomarina andamanensis]|nr:hypothetical protein [Pseudidiomarina andamanensis]
MLAFEIPPQISHQVGLTLISVIPAILANWFALKTQVAHKAPLCTSKVTERSAFNHTQPCYARQLNWLGESPNAD